MLADNKSGATFTCAHLPSFVPVKCFLRGMSRSLPSSRTCAPSYIRTLLKRCSPPPLFFPCALATCTSTSAPPPKTHIAFSDFIDCQHTLCAPPPKTHTGAVAPFLHDSLLDQVTQHLISKLQGGGLKPDIVRTYVQGLGIISKAVGYRWACVSLCLCHCVSCNTRYFTHAVYTPPPPPPSLKNHMPIY